MKILFVSSDIIPHIGGKSTHILDLINGFESNHIECDIISLTSLSKLKRNIIRVILLPLRLINIELYIYYFKLLWAYELNKLVYKYCEINKVDYISVQDAWAAYSLKKTIEKKRIPTIMTMHTYFGIENSLDRKMNNLSRKMYLKVLEKELISLEIVDSIITVDDRIKKHVEKEILEHNKGKVKCNFVKAIPNFTNTSKYEIISGRDKELIRKEYGISNDKFVVCCARRLVEKNGVINLVKAKKYIDDENVIILIAGEGPQRKAIEEYIEINSVKNISLLGSLYNDKIKKIYNLSDASVVPSITVNGLQEATSISAIESMACGLPTIASSIGGLLQIIADKETGILVEENNPAQIADAIVRLMKDKELYTKIKKHGRQYIVKNNSHLEASKEYLKQFEKSKAMMQKI